MKQTDIDRLKALCEKEGFIIIEGGLLPKDSILIEVVKKDPWEGVEFVKRVISHEGCKHRTGEIVKLPEPFKNGYYYPFSYTEDYFTTVFTPSTEQAYIEQLKKEAFERFGEIKIGDRFDRSNISEATPYYPAEIESVNFCYVKEYDKLYYGGVSIYKQGKWATKLPEKVGVEWFDWEYSENNTVSHKFKLKNIEWGKIENIDDLGDFLAKQLEKYLNEE